MTDQITFILPTRNDEYSCSSENKEEEQTKKILLPILSSKKYFPNSKFIVVEYCPHENKKTIKELLSGKVENVKIITIDKQLQEDLEKDFDNKKMNFYEHVSKHIGVLIADTKYICVLNQDVCLTNKNIQEILNSLEQNKICLARKCKITYESMKLSLSEMIENIEKNIYPYTEIGMWGNGDFLMMSKDLYSSIGGLLMAHQNWAIDNEILLRAGLTNMDALSSRSQVKFCRPTDIVCPDHVTDGHGRPFIGDVSDPFARNSRKISEEIVNNINSLKYIKKIEVI
jgi:hypothetical protein